MRYTLALILTLAGIAFVACGGDDEDDGSAQPATTAAEDGGAADEASEPKQNQGGGGDGKQGGPPERPGTEVVLAESQFGSVLFDSEQRAIYLFDKETTSESECYGECATAWPPVLTKGEPVAGDGVKSRLLGTTEREDGKTQVTYAGRPLYYYVDDPPGQVLCHNVSEFGGLWLVVEPDGEPAPV